jgi:hypothetical protein
MVARKTIMSITLKRRRRQQQQRQKTNNAKMPLSLQQRLPLLCVNFAAKKFSKKKQKKISKTCDAKVDLAFVGILLSGTERFWACRDIGLSSVCRKENSTWK